MELLDTVFFDNTVKQWLVAAAAGIATWVALRLIMRVVRGRLKALAGRTSTEWDDIIVAAISQTKRLFLLVVAVAVATRTLTVPDQVHRIIGTATVIMVLVQIGIWVTNGLTGWLTRYTRRELETDRSGATTVSAMGFVGKIIVWSLLLLVALDNLGIDITTLVAGLGVGGIAVALALQSILGDLFASLSIVIDKPFILGDFVIVDDQAGSVEHIGLKTTRVRSLWGEQVVFANSDLLKSRLRNYGRMKERRVAFDLGVTYQTTRDQLAAIPGIVREAIEAQPTVRFDRSHFKSFGDFALMFETVYYVTVPDYAAYMDIQQGINLALVDRFAAAGIEFAYPTQTLFVEKPGGAA